MKNDFSVFISEEELEYLINTEKKLKNILKKDKETKKNLKSIKEDIKVLKKNLIKKEKCLNKLRKIYKCTDINIEFKYEYNQENENENELKFQDILDSKNIIDFEKEIIYEDEYCKSGSLCGLGILEKEIFIFDKNTFKGYIIKSVGYQEF